MLELKPLSATRIVAEPAALDKAAWPADALALRLAADELLVVPAQPAVNVTDPFAIIIDDGSFTGGWLPEDVGRHFLAHCCEWRLPVDRPAFAQGAVAGVPVKLWFAPGRIFFIVEAAFAADFLEHWP